MSFLHCRCGTHAKAGLTEVTNGSCPLPSSMARKPSARSLPHIDVPRGGNPCINAGVGVTVAGLQLSGDGIGSRQTTPRRRRREPLSVRPLRPNNLGSLDPRRPPEERGAPCRPPEESPAVSRDAGNMAGRPVAPASQPRDRDGASPNVVARVSQWADDHLRLVRVPETRRPLRRWAGGRAERA